PVAGKQGVETDLLLNLVASLASDAPATEDVSATAGQAGLAFWYYALAGRIGETAAWQAMLTWESDTTTLRVGTGGVTCIDATTVAPANAGAGVMLQAFQAWQAAAPAESTTTVAPATVPNAVAVTACDPGVAVTTASNTTPLSFGGAFGEMA